MPTHPTPVEDRMIAAHASILQESPSRRCFMHSYFCQTSLPYRATEDQRGWSRCSGNLTLHIQAGYAPSADGEMVPVPLPCGPKARLLLIHLMTEAVLSASPKLDLRNNLTRFAKSVGIDTNGRNLRHLRLQLRSLATCTIRFVKRKRSHTEVVQGHLCEGFNMFHMKRRRKSWCSELVLSDAFYSSLVKHAVPLDPRALQALKHSASCVDTYLWLAQRLYRIKRGETALIQWPTLHNQLGGSSVRWATWKQGWLGKGQSRGTLPQVLAVYPKAQGCVEETTEGLVLRYAPPPVARFTT